MELGVNYADFYTYNLSNFGIISEEFIVNDQIFLQKTYESITNESKLNMRIEETQSGGFRIKDRFGF